jgi:hypothetical protein
MNDGTLAGVKRQPSRLFGSFEYVSQVCQAIAAVDGIIEDGNQFPALLAPLIQKVVISLAGGSEICLVLPHDYGLGGRWLSGARSTPDGQQHSRQDEHYGEVNPAACLGHMLLLN